MALPDSAGINFKAEGHIYTFQKVLLSITDPAVGTRCYAVSRIRIELAEGSYPAITLIVAPESFPASPQLASVGAFEFPAQETILAPTLQDFISENQQLQALVGKEGVVAGFALWIVRADNAEEQTVTINNWVLTGSGVVQGSAAGGWTVAVSIVHPAHRSTQGIGWLPNSTDMMSAPATAVGKNPVDLFLEALQDYYKQTETVINEPNLTGEGRSTELVDFDCSDQNGSSIVAVAEKSRERLNAALVALQASVAWDNGGGADLPFPEEAWADADYLLRMLWTQMSGQQPVWEQFLEQMSALELTVCGSPSDEKLLVRPFAPWGKAALVLYDREIWSIDMPPYDNLDIGGVVAAFSGGVDADALSVFDPIDGAQDVRLLPQLDGVAGYVCPLLAPKPLAGPVLAIDPPGWIRDYLYDAGGSYSPTDFPLNFDKYNLGAEQLSTGNEPPEMPPPVAATQEVFRDYVTAVRKYCKQVFLRSFRSGAGISLGTRLLIQSQNKFVLPGTVARIDSVTENEQTSQKPEAASATPALYFYITKVVHNIDVMAGGATTNLVGAFVRSPQDVGLGGLTAKQLTDGIPNAVYAADEQAG
jgi:hypothetical protein